MSNEALCGYMRTTLNIMQTWLLNRLLNAKFNIQFSAVDFQTWRQKTGDTPVQPTVLSI